MQCFVDLRSRLARQTLPGVHLHTACGEHLQLAAVDVDANAIVPLHNHPAEQAGMVLAGTPEFTIGDETRKLTPGDTYIIPGNVPHAVKAGPLPVRLLEVFSPVREEYKF